MVGEGKQAASYGSSMKRYSLDTLVKELCRASEELKSVFGEGFAGLLLFGSYARGEARRDSDVDILVVLRGLRGMKVRSRIYRVLARHVGLPLTLIDVNLNDLTREDLVVTPLLLNALYDGVIMYDETGVLAELKSKVGELIRKAKLVRYRTRDGKYGWKRRDDKPLEAVEV